MVVIPAAHIVIPQPMLSSPVSMLSSPRTPCCHPATHVVIPQPILSSRSPCCHTAAYVVIPRLDRGTQSINRIRRMHNKNPIVGLRPNFLLGPAVEPRDDRVEPITWQTRGKQPKINPPCWNSRRTYPDTCNHLQYPCCRPEKPLLSSPQSILSSRNPYCHPAAHVVIPQPMLSSRSPCCHPAA